MDKARILLLDIETAPATVYSWGIYEQDIPINHIISYPWLMCWSAKWLGERRVMSDAAINYPTEFWSEQKDKSVCKGAWKLLNEADIVVAHNGDEFDCKRLNTYFLKNGMKPPRPYKTVDTKKVARGNFSFISNKLDSLCRELEIGAKMKHGGMDMWKDCLAGKQAAWNQMVRYNKKDVILLEELYLTLRPYMKAHPVVQPSDSCTHCGSKSSQRHGWYFTRTSKLARRQCNDCGAWYRGEKDALPLVKEGSRGTRLKAA